MRRKGRDFMSRIEDMIAETKLYEVLQKRDNDKTGEQLCGVIGCKRMSGEKAER